MMNKIKHTIGCVKCNKMIPLRNYNEVEESLNTKSKCCNSNYEYLGYQLFEQTILKETNNHEDCFNNLKDNESEELTNLKNNESEELNNINDEKIEVSSNIKIEDIIEVSSNIKIEDIIDVNNKVTNKQMIPAIKIALEEDSKVKISLLKTHYPKVFESSVKYIGKRNQQKLNNYEIN